MGSQVPLLTLEEVPMEAAWRTFPKRQKTRQREKSPGSAKQAPPPSDSEAAKSWEARVRERRPLWLDLG